MPFRKRKQKQINRAGMFFDDSLLKMSYGSRLSVRVVINVWVIVQIAATITFILSDVEPLFWLGAISLLYLAGRIFHINHADYSLADTSRENNLVFYITPRARRLIILAYDKATLLGGDFLLHLTKLLVDISPVQETLKRLEVNPDEFISKINQHLKHQRGVKKKQAFLLKEVESLVLSAFDEKNEHQRFIDRIDLFVALGATENKSIRALFSVFEIDIEDLDQVAIFGRLKGFGRRLRAPVALIGSIFQPKRSKHRIMNRAWTARPTPILDELSVDLTDRARRERFGFLVGHDDEYSRLVNVLSRPVKPNILLIGEAGVGKSAIVEYLSHMMVKDTVPKELFDKRIVILDVGRLVAGADQATLQARTKAIFDEIAIAGNVILFIPEIHNLFKTAEAHEITVASTVLPMITSEKFLTIGATTPQDFKQYIEKDSSFKQAFEIIRVNEATPEEACFILVYRALFLEKQFKVKITYGAIKTAVRLAKKYFHETPLPSSAEDLLREATTYVMNKGRDVLRGDDIIDVAEERVNVPIHEVEHKEAESLLRLEELIHERLIDQEEAVKIVSDALRAYRSGLSKGGGPIGTFLFVGPTGVGKTELAKILSEIQFGSEGAMARFDMSEYQDTQSINRLIGSPDGKLGGMLTGRVIEKPYSLLLLDEFEKAHPDVLKLFLQVFDDGRLTDNWGRTVSFENTIIIATSNAEANFIKEKLDEGKAMQDIDEELRKRLAKYFSPELLNRFSAVVVFKTLTIEEIERVVSLKLGELRDTLQEKHNISLDVDNEAVKLIAEMGYDPAFGARPLQRVISDKLRGGLAEMILAKKIGRGAKIGVGVTNGKLEISIL